MPLDGRVEMGRVEMGSVGMGGSRGGCVVTTTATYSANGVPLAFFAAASIALVIQQGKWVAIFCNLLTAAAMAHFDDGTVTK